MDVIAERTGLDAAVVASTLITLQLKRLVDQMPGGVFTHARRGK